MVAVSPISLSWSASEANVLVVDNVIPPSNTSDVSPNSVGRIGDKSTETALLEAVELYMMQNLGLSEDECGIHIFDSPPAITGNQYISILPNGWNPGSVHLSSGGVFDEVCGVEIAVTIRAAHYPRDRKHKKYLRAIDSLNSMLSKILDLVDFEYHIINMANQFLIELEGDNSQGFHHPLSFSGIDQKPSIVSSDHFNGQPGEKSAGVARSIYFGDARRTRERKRYRSSTC